ncbi:DUF4191 family protein [Leucobacter insecticola]|uniref:DUF4191 family protein n=1 Tax=Leucobacter insecticola TaxID=2714934 RepID=A0A6G8FJM6_9MICO|nr:DUF4191 domain-containing protein [Leucobacter insecticola]QIM16577.1 DUF4191 family protein [Leucobacter insecticola]
MAAEKAKRNGRIKQMVEIYKITRQRDRNLTLILLICFLGPLLASLLLAWLLPGSWLNWIVWPLSGILVGILLVMIMLGRRAEKSAYQQIEGRPGAVGSVIQSALRRSWRGSEVPVAINREQDAVYRVIGRGGVVLIAEGSYTRTRRMVADEERKMKRAVKDVEVVHLYVGPDDGGIPLHNLSKTLVKLKSKLTRAEVDAIYNRLVSLQGSPVGIPKGMDPNRIRPQRPR